MVHQNNIGFPRVWKVSQGGSDKVEMQQKAYIEKTIRVKFGKIVEKDYDFDGNFKNTRKSNQLAIFKNEIEIGDYVIVSKKNLHASFLAKVTGEYKYNPKDLYSRSRAIETISSYDNFKLNNIQNKSTWVRATIEKLEYASVNDLFADFNVGDAQLKVFYEWYDQNKVELLIDANARKFENDKLKAAFQEEWPISRLLNMEIDDYITGKSNLNKSLCYELLYGKYKSLFYNILVGSNGQLGIYWSKDKSSYCNQANKAIAEFELDEVFNTLKKDLVSIIERGVEGDFSSSAFASIGGNSFYGRASLVVKLICAYSKNSFISGININSDIGFWKKFANYDDKQGGVYKLNHDITSLISTRYEELNSDILGMILKEYYDYSKKSNGEKEVNEMSQFQNKYSKTVLNSKNVIFRGAPGTGKTYLAKSIAADIISEGATQNFNELTKEQRNQIEFVQFHPSYDYTDFVEGLRPNTNDDGSIGFKLESGVFKKFVDKARENYDDAHKEKSILKREKSAQLMVTDFIDNLELGSTKFTTLTNNEFYIVGINNRRIQILIPSNGTAKNVTFAISDLEKMLKSDQKFNVVKDVADFFEKKNYRQAFSYILPIYKEIKKSSSVDKNIEIGEVTEKPFIFIIDEINRGEISKIFGELFFSIDPGYRGESGAISTQYSNLREDEDSLFYVPDNVCIIGTMNDIDRSVDSFDFAMRRRFRFINIKVAEHVNMLEGLTEIEEAISRMNALNNAISEVEDLNENYHIGASYFLKLKDVGFEDLWSDYLEPLLQDYVRGLYNETDILDGLKKAYDLVDDRNDTQGQ